MTSWETKEGIEFLWRVGVKERQTVLDCGCGVGRYSIPAALLVGAEGLVYAVDKNMTALQRPGDTGAGMTCPAQHTETCLPAQYSYQLAANNRKEEIYATV